MYIVQKLSTYGAERALGLVLISKFWPSCSKIGGGRELTLTYFKLLLSLLLSVKKKPRVVHGEMT